MKKLLTLLLVLALLVPYTSWADSGTFYADSGGDDGYWKTGGTTFNNSSNGMLTGMSGYNTFILFEGVTIPNGSTISSATITVYCQTAYATVVDVNLYFEDADNAVACTGWADCDGKSLTTGIAGQFPNPWAYQASWTSNSMASDLEDVVGRVGWSSGNDIQVFIKGGAGEADYKSIGSWEWSDALGDYYAKLDVTWGAGGSSWTLDVGGVSAANVGEIGDTPIANVDKFGGTDGTP